MAVVSDFHTSEGRAAAHDGLKAELANSKPAMVDAGVVSFGWVDLILAWRA
jgi:hypothetical protein